MKSKISIIVPTLNAASHIDNFLNSLTKQTFKDFEVIINDDKRTNDNTVQIIKKYSKDLDIKHLHTNISMAQGRKAGAKEAKGNYLFHLDADMSLSPKVLEECIKKSNEGYDALIVPEVSYGVGYWAAVKALERSTYVGDDTIESARFFKASAYWSVDGHNEKMVLSEDKDMDLRIREAGFKVGRIQEVIYHNEGKLSLFKTIKKKFFYGKTAHVFMSSHPSHSVKQANLIFRPAYFRHMDKLIKNPILSLGLIVMKSSELFAALCGFIYSKLTTQK